MSAVFHLTRFAYARQLARWSASQTDRLRHTAHPSSESGGAGGLRVLCRKERRLPETLLLG
jgi:hypothetical protein